MTATPQPVLIMAGGTGGHVFPALAVARRLRERGVPVVWLGTRRGLEARVVPEAGLPIEWLTVTGLRGKHLAARLLAPLRLAGAMAQAVRVLLRHRPGVVLGMGGFVAGPGGAVAWLLRRPLVIHEQNAVAGLTNRLLARVARRVLTAFPDTFPARADAELIGNPVREDIAALPEPAQRLAGREGPARLLVLGGSQGAGALNEVVPVAVAGLAPALRPEVWHQSGAAQQAVTRERYREAGVQARTDAFIDDMAQAYAWADLVVCRAGALTIAELAAAGLGAVLVPYPHAVDDHQTRNADYLVAARAAVLIPQRDLTAARLVDALTPLLAERETLLRMAEAARARARPDAAQRVVEACLAEVAA